MRNATGAKKASAAQKREPVRKGPPKRPMPSAQSSSRRARSRLSGAPQDLSVTRIPQLNVQASRKAKKPECISALAHRAQARAVASAGQTPAWRSARYSVMASESHTVVLPSTRQGTLPVGEKPRNASGLAAPPNGTRFSRNGMFSSRMSIQGRNDHEE